MSKPNHVTEFEAERRARVASYVQMKDWKQRSLDWLHDAFIHKYMYNFTCLGRPIIQTPIDMIAVQEIIWAVRPDLVIETGIAHGGSLILSASMLALLDYVEAIEHGKMLDPKAPRRRVLGVDIDIRAHNRAAIESHPLSNRIDMIQGSSVATDVIERVHEIAAGYERILVMLDSNHTHEHVLKELEAYAPLTTRGSYCIVFDTAVEDLPDSLFPDRPWHKGDNPKTAVWKYLELLKTQRPTGADGTPLEFEVDADLEAKLLISVAPNGYLKRR